ncbi:MerR family transcriptional regulator [bacterium]|nr:MerR family transcriptional regulator [bacterium]
MSKKRFRIGDVARELKIKKFVIRFWEKEFGLKSDRSSGGQRFYDKEDFEIFKTIKELLYSKGFTIAGARLQIKLAQGGQGVLANSKISPATTTDTFDAPAKEPPQKQAAPNKEALAKIKVLKKELLRLREKLA